MGKKKDKKRKKLKKQGMLAKASSALGGLVSADPKNGKPRALELAQLAASIVALLRAEKANDDVEDLEDDAKSKAVLGGDKRLRERIDEIVDERLRVALESDDFRRLVRRAVRDEIERIEEDEDDDEDDELDEGDEEAA
jgi:hypothetical protein